METDQTGSSSWRAASQRGRASSMREPALRAHRGARPAVPAGSHTRTIIKDEINVKTDHDRETGTAGSVDFTFKLKPEGRGQEVRQARRSDPIVPQVDAAGRNQPDRESRRTLVYLRLEGESFVIALDELPVEKQAKSGFASASGYQLTVAINTDITPELEQEGLVREVISAPCRTRAKSSIFRSSGASRSSWTWTTSFAPR